MCRAILLVFLLVVVAIGVAAYYLPWWGTLLLVLGLFVLGPWIGKRLVLWLVQRLFMGMFDRKSRVLRGAAVEVHSVTPTAAPARARRVIEGTTASDGQEILDAPKPDETEAEPDDADDTDRKFFVVEATITPRDSQGPFHHWDLSEVEAVRHDLKVTLNSQDDGACVVREATVLGGEVEAEGGDTKYAGSRRVRMTLGVRPGVSRLKLKYYFETFGDIRLPG